MRKIRVLLADDHALFRAGLLSLLRNEPLVQVVGEASEGDEAVTLAARLSPDVVLMDIGMPGLGGIEATRRIHRARAETGIVMLTMYDDAQSVEQALRAGARAYVLKDAATEHLVEAIRTVARGETYLSPGVSDFVAQGYLVAQDAAVDPLTPREREVLQGIAEGQTSREIAERIGLAAKTVQNVRTRIMEKLNIHTTAGLVRYAFRAGVVR